MVFLGSLALWMGVRLLAVASILAMTVITMAAAMTVQHASFFPGVAVTGDAGEKKRGQGGQSENHSGVF